jgi:hypothetical protein
LTEIATRAVNLAVDQLIDARIVDEDGIPNRFRRTR